MTLAFYGHYARLSCSIRVAIAPLERIPAFYGHLVGFCRYPFKTGLIVLKIPFPSLRPHFFSPLVIVATSLLKHFMTLCFNFTMMLCIKTPRHALATVAWLPSDQTSDRESLSNGKFTKDLPWLPHFQMTNFPDFSSIFIFFSIFQYNFFLVFQYFA